MQTHLLCSNVTRDTEDCDADSSGTASTFERQICSIPWIIKVLLSTISHDTNVSSSPLTRARCAAVPYIILRIGSCHDLPWHAWLQNKRPTCASRGARRSGSFILHPRCGTFSSVSHSPSPFVNWKGTCRPTTPHEPGSGHRQGS